MFFHGYILLRGTQSLWLSQSNSGVRRSQLIPGQMLVNCTLRIHLALFLELAYRPVFAAGARRKP